MSDPTDAESRRGPEERISGTAAAARPRAAAHARAGRAHPGGGGTLAYIPGLLQTADYSRAIFVGSKVRDGGTELDTAIAVRAIRQERLTSTDHPLELAAIIDESVLHRLIGGPDVLAAQLEHLAEATLLDRVTLQVLPAAAGAHPAIVSPFTVLSFGHLHEPDVAYVEHTLGSLFMRKEAEVRMARRVFDQLRSDALSPADSAALIRQVANGS